MSETRPRPPKRGLSPWTWTLIFTLVGLAVFVALSFYADINALARSFLDFSWQLVPLILFLTLLNYFLRFVKWHYYLRVIGVSIGFGDSLSIFLSGLTMSVTPAKLGEVFKSYLLQRVNGTDLSRSMPVVIAERVTDILGLLVLALLSFSAFEYGLGMLLATMGVLVVLMALLQSRRVCRKAVDLMNRLPGLRRLSASLDNSFESIMALFCWRSLVMAVVISTVSWGFECFAMYFVLLGFGVKVSIALSTFVFAFSSLAGALTLIPGGLIVAEGSIAGLLLLNGMSKETAAGTTIIIRFCTLWFGVGVGAMTLMFSGKKLGKPQITAR